MITCFNLMCGYTTDMCLCLVCGKDFVANPMYRKKYGTCSDNCKRARNIERQNKYKDSEKGRLANERWIKSERRKNNEIAYRQNPEAKKKAVERQTRYLKEKPHLQEYKRRIGSIYIRRTQGRLKKWWNEQLKKQDGHCLLCESTDKLSVDHIIPVSKGGSDGTENLQILCYKCNSIKSNNLPNEL